MNRDVENMVILRRLVKQAQPSLPAPPNLAPPSSMVGPGAALGAAGGAAALPLLHMLITGRKPVNTKKYLGLGAALGRRRTEPVEVG